MAARASRSNFEATLWRRGGSGGVVRIGTKGAFVAGCAQMDASLKERVGSQNEGWTLFGRAMARFQADSSTAGLGGEGEWLSRCSSARTADGDGAGEPAGRETRGAGRRRRERLCVGDCREHRAEESGFTVGEEKGVGESVSEAAGGRQKDRTRVRDSCSCPRRPSPTPVPNIIGQASQRLHARQLSPKPNVSCRPARLLHPESPPEQQTLLL